MNEYKIKATLRRINEKAVPSTLDGWSGIEKRLAARKTIRQQKLPINRRIPLKLVYTVIVLVVSLTAGIWLVRPQQTISASEVLRRAIQGQQINTINGYQGIIRKQLDNGATQIEEHIWREFPDKRRVEVYMNTTEEPVVQQLNPVLILSEATDKALTLNHIDVATGTERYWYSINLRGATRMALYPITDMSDGKTYNILDWGGGIYGDGVGTLWLLFDPQSIDSLVEVLNRRVTDLQLVGTQTIAGQPAYVLTFASKYYLPNTNELAHITAWIDQESYLLLGERWESSDKKYHSEWQFTNFEPNPVTNDAVFSFDAPSNVLVLYPNLELFTKLYDYNSGSWSLNDLMKPKDFTRLVQELKQKVDYKILLPASYTALPDLMPSPPIYNASGITTLKYQSANNGMALVILQGSPATLRQLDPCISDAQCETVNIGDLTGHYLADVENSAFHSMGMGYYNVGDIKPTQVQWLGFEHDGTYILMRTEYDPKFRNYAVSKSDLLKVAASLQEAK